MSRVGRTGREVHLSFSSLLCRIGALLALLPACGARSKCDGIACAPACPRDAARDPSGRCACVGGDVLVLGACVPPAVGDKYCGPAAKLAVDGCVFTECSDGERLDVVTGACFARRLIAGRDTLACADGIAPVIVEGHVSCVGGDALCPRGSRHVGSACVRPPRCPPGTLPEGDACRSIVTAGARDGDARVDVGAWASLVLGVDGGPGTPDLCGPLGLRPNAFGLAPGAAGVVHIRLAITAADQDLSRVDVRTRAELVSEPTAHAGSGLSREADAWVLRSAETLIEPLRGLGGQASAAAVELSVRCRINRL